MTDQFKSTFGQAGCHIENVGELLQQFDTDFVNAEGKIIKLTGEQALTLVRMLWNKFGETMEECEEKTIEIEFGDGPIANLMEQLLTFLLLSGNINKAKK